MIETFFFILLLENDNKIWDDIKKLHQHKKNEIQILGVGAFFYKNFHSKSVLIILSFVPKFNLFKHILIFQAHFKRMTTVSTRPISENTEPKFRLPMT